MGWRRAGLIGMVAVLGGGCAISVARRSPWDIEQLAQLSDQLEQFKTLARLKAEEAEQLRRAKALLDAQVSSADVNVGYDARGLVTRMLDQVLFHSGKADLRRDARAILDQLAQVLGEVSEQPIRIEGHTDNVPITHSGWADNAALSLARANAVAEYLTQQRGISRDRMTIVGYGEERPIASNDTAQGRRKNRRVEVIILPQATTSSTAPEAERTVGGGTESSK
ncbi:MAG: OmpA family protein [Candidatus Omnitrophota bacterium]|nr:OmpA family protein [Candidatus Omnitrophota bacterium]